MIDFGIDIYLGPLDSIDPDLLRLWRNDYRVWRYCRQHDLLAREAHLKWLDVHCDTNEQNKMYSIIDPKSRMGLGVCGLTNIDSHNRTGEFSLYINPNLHGKGHGKKALMTLISHGFMNLGLSTIWGETYDFNPARYLFGKVGMILEGTRRNFYFREGRSINAHLYSILKEEWEVLPLFDGFRSQKCLP